MKTVNTPYSKMVSNFSILLFTCKLALVVSFKGKYSVEFRVLKRGN